MLGAYAGERIPDQLGQLIGVVLVLVHALDALEFGQLLLAVLLVLLSCRKDEDPDPAPEPPNTPSDTSTVDTSTVDTAIVSFDLNLVPYDSLSKYHFFEGALADFSPSVGVVPS